MGKLGAPGAILLAGALVALAVYLRPDWSATVDSSGAVTIIRSDVTGSRVEMCMVRQQAGQRQCVSNLDALREAR